MIKKSYLNISFVSAGNILNTILGFVFLIAIARALSIEDMGRYALLTGLLIFLSKGTDFGTNSLYISKSIKDNDLNIQNKFYSTKIILTILLIPLSIITLYFLKLLSLNIGIIFLVGFISYAINFTIYSIFQKIENYLMVILVNFSIAIVKFIFAILIILNILSPNLIQAFTIFSFSVIPSLLLIFFVPKELIKFRFSPNHIKEFFLTSVPAGVSLMIAQGWTAIATTINSVFKNYTSAGIYYIADKISTIFSLVSLSIFTVLLPKNAKRKKDNKTFDFKETIYISIIVLLMAIIFSLTAQFIIIPVFGIAYKESLSILYILLFASAFNAISTFLENYFFVEDITKKLLPISVVKLLTFVVLSIALIPAYSLYGVAYSSLFSSLTTLFLTIYYIKMNNKKINV